MKPKLYSINELSGILKLHPKTILRFIHEGKIQARKIGRSWMVSEEELKNYCHAELAEESPKAAPTESSPLEERISVSAVIEIREQNSEEASRISNSLIAMLNSEKGSGGNNRFDFFYYPEIEKAKYLFYGNPEFIVRILKMFEIISSSKGERND